MIIEIHTFSRLDRPGIYVWRLDKGGNLVTPSTDDRTTGWSTFEVRLDPQLDESAVYVKLVGRDLEGKGTEWESDVYNRELKRTADGSFPAEVWLFQDARRLLTADPFAAAPSTRLTIHLVTLNRYRESQLYLWDADGQSARFEPTGSPDHLGPVFTLDLIGVRQQFFYFKFVRGERHNGNRTEFEPTIANRVFVAGDGHEIWVHSEADLVRTTEPVLRPLIVHLHKESDRSETPLIHLWQPGSGFEKDLPPEPEGDGWTAHRELLYTDIEYSFYVRYRSPGGDWIENERAHRRLSMSKEKECWTIEGDKTVFDAKPERDLAVTIRIADRPEGEIFGGHLQARVGVRDANGWSITNLPVSGANENSFMAYRGIFLKLDYVPARYRNTGIVAYVPNARNWRQLYGLCCPVEACHSS